MKLRSAWNMIVIVLVIMAIGMFQQGCRWNPWEDGSTRTKLALASIFSLVAWGSYASTLYYDLNRRSTWWLGILTGIPLLLIVSSLNSLAPSTWSADTFAWILWLIVPAIVIATTRKSLWQLVFGFAKKWFP